MSRKLIVPVILAAVVLTVVWPLAYDVRPAQQEDGNPYFRLIQVFLCEAVMEGAPSGQAVAFSVSRGTACCYTLFDEIKEDTFVYHRWLFRDKPASNFKLSVKQPRWATFSSIQFRDDDKGPWKVEIRDASSRLIRTVRFSVVD